MKSVIFYSYVKLPESKPTIYMAISTIAILYNYQSLSYYINPLIEIFQHAMFDYQRLHQNHQNHPKCSIENGRLKH